MIRYFKIPPLLAPLFFFICGVVAAGSFGFLLPRYPLPIATVLSLIYLVIPRQFKLRQLLLPAVFVVGNLLITSYLSTPPDLKAVLGASSGEPFQVSGTVVQRGERKEGGCRLMIRPESVMTEDGGKAISFGNGLIMVKVGDSRRDYSTGDRVNFVSKLKSPRNLGTYGEFNAERYYNLKRIFATSFVISDDGLQLVPPAKTGFQRHFDLTALKIGRFVMAQLPGVEGGIMKALITGDMADLPQNIKDAYSRTGVNHILSISGFHVGIIFLALMQLYWLVSRLFPALLLRHQFRQVSIIAALPIILYYMFLSGAAPATGRSVLMLAIPAIALLMDRDSDSLSTLALAAAALLLTNPANLYDISFQLSFLAIWGLIVITPVLDAPFLEIRQTWLKTVLTFTSASTAAVLVTLLPVALYFQQLTLTGIISNFLIVPLLGYGAVIAGFIALPLIFTFPLCAALLLKGSGYIVSLSNSIIFLFDKIPVLPVFIPETVDILFLISSLLLISIIRNLRLRAGVIIAAIVLITVPKLIPAKGPDYLLCVDFLSVGQGESTLIRFADGRVALLDGGGSLFDNSRDIGKELLLPVLRNMGIKKIDYMILSHSHPDHLQGLKTVAKILPVGEFWESGLNSGSEYEEIKHILKKKGVHFKYLNNDSPPFEVAGVNIRAFHPLPPDKETFYSEMNETSLVIKLEGNGNSLLMSGDVGFESEFRMLKNRAPLRSTVLKIPHHGSKYSTSPEFLEAVAPDIAIISAGYENSFGLPAIDTLCQLNKAGVNLFRTDIDGSIKLILPKNGEKPVITTYKRAI